MRASALPSASGRSGTPILLHRASLTPFRGFCRPARCSRLLKNTLPVTPGASAAFDASSGGQHDETAAQLDYKPFPRRRERDPYKLLGISKEANIEEVVDAKNYLVELYKWHEESRESVELAYDAIMQEHYNSRHKNGFRPPRTGRRGEAIAAPKPSLFSRITDMFDTTISLVGLVNEGVPYAAMALWALFSLDQSFPLAGAFAYSVYKFQNKRVKADPEGPYFGGNPIVGALLTTLCTLALACGVMAVLTTPLAPFMGPNARQVSACITVIIMGLLGVYLK